MKDILREYRRWDLLHLTIKRRLQGDAGSPYHDPAMANVWTDEFGPWFGSFQRAMRTERGTKPVELWFSKRYAANFVNS
jgi:hypothetical protein